MNIVLKTEEEIRKMRESGRILYKILTKAKTFVIPGITTGEINTRIEEEFKKYPVQSAFKGYRGFPAAACINVNEEVVHAIPGNRILKEDDIVSIDCGAIYEGFCSDAAITVGVGKLSSVNEKFLKTAEKALEAGIFQIKPGNKTGDIGAAIQKIVESAGYNIIKEYVGHGIGQRLHEPPEVPNFGKTGKGIALKPGMTIAIEPIIAMGKRFTKIMEDKWTVVTRDGLPAIQVEKTVAVTHDGVEILTC